MNTPNETTAPRPSHWLRAIEFRKHLIGLFPLGAMDQFRSQRHARFVVAGMLLYEGSQIIECRTVRQLGLIEFFRMKQLCTCVVHVPKLTPSQ